MYLYPHQEHPSPVQSPIYPSRLSCPVCAFPSFWTNKKQAVSGILLFSLRVRTLNAEKKKTNGPLDSIFADQETPQINR